MKIKKCILEKNDCYKANEKMKPAGIVVHSTGANNPNLKRYVQPDDGILGENPNKNDWNRPGVGKCVHAFIGLDEKGKVRVYQTLPWTMKCWGCGSGKKGSYNSNRIQFEICEDALVDQKYFDEVFAAAAELCAFLCEKYGFGVDKVVSHAEAHQKGYASNHGDCDHWLKNFGKDMDWLRREAQKRIPKEENTSYRVRVTAYSLNVRNGAGAKFRINNVVKRGEVYTIVDEEKNGWGKLKSGAGWVNLKYTERL